MLKLKHALAMSVVLMSTPACQAENATPAAKTDSAASAAAISDSADLIFTNGHFYTTDGWAKSIAVDDGVIVAISKTENLTDLKSSTTKVIDLAGDTVFPGLHDMHIHAMGSGQKAQSCSWPQGSSAEVALATIGECVAKAEKGEWVQGGQWDSASFGQKPSRQMLDKLAPDNPVALTDISYHSLWVNSKALELAGITAETKTPEGGVIEKDENGQPTGILRETATGLVRMVIPPPSEEDKAEALKWAIDLISSYGITGFTDAGVSENELVTFTTLADRGDLKLRVRACQWGRGLVGVDSDEELDDALAKMRVNRNKFARDNIKPDCIKLALDGVPTDGHTAAMLEPYQGAHNDAGHGDKGITMIPQEKLNRILVKADNSGFTVKMHAAGDAAVRSAMDGIAATRKANGFSGNLHDIAHNSFVNMDDINRARDIAATFEMSPYIWFPNPIIPDIEKAVGKERMKRWTPVKDAIDAGALVVPGSDWAVVPSVNPWLGIETLVTRQKPGGGGEMLGAVERITLKQAIDLYTVNAAKQMGTRDKTGAIAVGMLADIIVLDRNPFDIPIYDVHNTQVKMSFIGGEKIYQQ
ncbi:amidohydrolase [Alteromonas gilva]|uniref:Amidohydrolase n=1 Tax=Alteromonas gilva TaxID=2987522 RepID=A0ABT5KZQ2_9ALTE|nr:amidohydrolase [Alteromonas gilva]MDC8830249.1 amidohydrolase [Alteromonas gilva]